jgi:polyhydroxybutyrate depolymerase
MKKTTKISILLSCLFIVVNTVWAQTGSFMYKGSKRDYIIHLPPSYTPGKKYPLVLNLHGLTSNASQQQAYSQMDKVADTANFIVVYPNGLSNTWNSGFSAPNTGTDDVGFLSALIDTMIKNYSIDVPCIFSSGMSMGGFMSYRLACELETKIAAIASVTGLMADNVKTYCHSTRPVPILHFHGTTDATVPYAGFNGYAGVEDNINYWIKKNKNLSQAVVTPVADINKTDNSTVTIYGYGSDSTEVLFYKITGGGHTWPGATFAIPNVNTNKDINASTEIWNFFKRHCMKQSPNSIPEKSKQEIIRFFPNPFTNELKLDLYSPEIKSISITNLVGQFVYNLNNFKVPSVISIPSGSFESGVYILKVETTKKQFVYKIIKI